MIQLDTILEHYRWLESLFTLLSCITLTLLGKRLLVLIPAFKAASINNRQIAQQRMSRGFYAVVQRRSSIAGLSSILFAFVLVVPFCVNDVAPDMGHVIFSGVVLLMLYDFLYYLTHRFVFHGSLLLRIHAVHHQQRNPCLMDANYLHPLETIIGLSLYLVSVIIITLILGRFHWLALAIFSVTYIQINEQNHRLMDLPYFPFKYLSKISALHHVHHSGFTSGNYATLTPLFDWLFGTYDTGKGPGREL